MAETNIAEVYEPLTFRAGVDEMAVELNAFASSGILVPDPQIAAQISGGGRLGEIPYFGPLANNEPNYSTDVSANKSTPEQIAGKLDKFRLALMNNSWSTMDLARALGLKDPLQGIINKVGQWWATVEQTRFIKLLLGILADNVANDSGDMVYDISTDDAAAIADAERISASAVLLAAQTMGDHADALMALAVHSVVATRLRLQNVTSFVSSAADANVQIEMYLGKYRLIVDDSLPAVAGTNRITYTSILFAAGAAARETVPAPVASELKRDPDAGVGGGQDTLFSRRHVLLHPYGFQFTSTTVAGVTPTLAECILEANWDRSVDRKLVGFAFLKTNG
jgi:hypothetical protein